MEYRGSYPDAEGREEKAKELMYARVDKFCLSGALIDGILYMRSMTRCYRDTLFFENLLRTFPHFITKTELYKLLKLMCTYPLDSRLFTVMSDDIREILGRFMNNKFILLDYQDDVLLVSVYHTVRKHSYVDGCDDPFDVIRVYKCNRAVVTQDGLECTPWIRGTVASESLPDP